MARRTFWRVLGSRVQRILATGSSSRKKYLVVKVVSLSCFSLTLESSGGVDWMHWLWSVMLTRSWTTETSSWRAWRENGSNSCNLRSFSCKPCFLHAGFKSQQPWSSTKLSRSVYRKTWDISWVFLWVKAERVKKPSGIIMKTDLLHYWAAHMFASSVSLCREKPWGVLGSVLILNIIYMLKWLTINL